MTPYIVTTKAIGLSKCGGRKPQSLLTAARHNLREIQAENGANYGKIDPKRMKLNMVLIGQSKASDVEAASLALFYAADIDPKKKRKDYNQAHETVISLEGDKGAAHFFQTIAAHADYIFGTGVVLSFIVHNDQGQPHCHVLTSPIESGSYLGSKRMKGAALDGLKRRLNEITNPIGFTRKEKATRRDLSEKAAAIVAELERLNHPLLSYPIFQPIMRMLQKDPSPLFEFLGLNGLLSPQTTSETRLRKERGKESKPRHCKGTKEKEQSLSCVGIEQKMLLHLQPTAPALQNNCEEKEQTELEIVEPTMKKESDQDPNTDDTTTGEFIKPPAKPKGSGRLKVNAWVLDALAARM